MSPTYLRTEWVHDFEDEPYLLYYELDDERYATRKIEIFKNGETIRAGEKDLKRDPMALPDQPAPPVEETDALGEFRAREITAQAFEVAWSAACGDR